MTPTQRRALTVLAEHTSIADDRWVNPAEFGTLAYRTEGQPLHSDRAAVRPAATMLARLYREGLVFRRKPHPTGPYEYAITGNARLAVLDQDV